MATASPPADTRQAFYLQWSPVVAGAVVAAALAFVLHSFAIALGLAVSSTAPTWRDSSAALWTLSGLYLILVALASYGLGGYIAGRMRAPLTGLTADETESRDGAHGLLVWAIATLLTALIALAAAQSMTRLAAPAADEAGPSASVGGENIIAYDLDRLFRADMPPEGVALEHRRAEAARILLTASRHRGMTTDDRNYLVRLVANTTGLAPPEAEKRVATITAQASENIVRARRSAVVLAFMIGAAALLGAAVAWFAACAGGAHHGSNAPSLQWGWTGPRRVTRKAKP